MTPAAGMRVIATAGHVDHGKSTLVRALTGMEPDRWAEERRRGMTIDLGFAWTSLPDGRTLSFVDVPGHARFLGNMLAGLGPAPAVLVVVAADEGWREQSAEHLEAVDALGLRHGLLAVTRSDLADPSEAVEQARAQIAQTSLGGVEAVAVSGATGAGLDDLRSALARLAAGLPEPDLAAPVRLWVDRAFTVRGAGTVVTGTLGAGSLAVGDELLLRGSRVGVRGLQSLGRARDRVDAYARVAVNLRGIEVADIGRGDALLGRSTAGEFAAPSPVVDVRLRRPGRLPGTLTLHVGTAAVPVRVRPLGGDTSDVLRLTLARPLPLVPGDRALLRDPGSRAVVGVEVLDSAPPALRRRGDSARRAVELREGPPDLAVRLTRAGALPLPADLAEVPATAAVVGGWLVDRTWWRARGGALADAVAAHLAADPLSPGLPAPVALARADLPDPALLPVLVAAAGLEQSEGRVRPVGYRPDLGPAEPSVRRLEERLQRNPFDAPDAEELRALRLGPKELAAAERAGRLVRLPGDVLLAPAAPALAARALAALPQPFTVSAARQALAVSRRVAVPLLEELDRRRWTRRGEDGLRTMRR